jgi:hypothetical protein
MTFNTTSDEYNDKLKSQDYRCALCSRFSWEGPKVLVVDKKNRDLLCTRCNILLGHLEKAGQALVTKAFAYVKKHKDGN